ncbi:MAG: HPF/RaiA family ribosome-associated protein [Sedimentisphaerales bacterium]|nr:HPF/RaiA family ribosome-associated protein [Sedimentisphaerales bacterium]
MKTPLEITLRGVKGSPQLEEIIRNKVSKLERICGYMIRCRVAVEKPHKYVDSGSPYRVRIDMTVPPKHELVVKQRPGRGDMHAPLEIVLKDIFSIAARTLRKLVDQQHGQTKTHPNHQVTALVDRLFPEKDFGFLRTVDTNDDIYFHKNSVRNGDFNRMRPGAGVRFHAELGDKGLQATTVEILDRNPRPG